MKSRASFLILKGRRSNMAIRKPIELTERERYEIKFTSGRVNLLAFIVITVVNIVAFIINQSVLLPFSAAVPYYTRPSGAMSSE